jgi:hypothetical protein
MAVVAGGVATSGGGCTYEVRPGAAAAPLRAGYRRREPEKTALHRLVRENLATFLSEAMERSADGHGLPRYVEKEFEKYLACGDLRLGFARVVCRDCRHEAVVGFSCKRRGFCPSCTARRAHEAAAHLVDTVVPRVPVRQWVLSFPKRLRYLLARDTKLLGEVLGCFLRCLFAYHRRRARKLGTPGSAPGAISYLQWFGSALQLTPHFHCIIPDGVFVEDKETGETTFFPLPAPADEEVDGLLLALMKKVHALLTKRGFFGDEGQAASGPEALAKLQQEGALGQRQLGLSGTEAAREARAKQKRTAFREGFSLHASQHLHANDRQALERLCLYAGRGPIAQERLTMLPDGRVSYRMKRPGPDGRSHLVCSPVAFLRRLASITPPPRVNLLRFHGVFAPNSRLRKRIVPTPEAVQPSEPPPSPRQGTFDFVAALMGAVATKVSSRLSWAELLQRTFRTDVLLCPQCQGRMRVVAFTTDAAVAREVLARLGLARPRPARPLAAGPPQLALAFPN